MLRGLLFRRSTNRDPTFGSYNLGGTGVNEGMGGRGRGGEVRRKRWARRGGKVWVWGGFQKGEETAWEVKRRVKREESREKEARWNKMGWGWMGWGWSYAVRVGWSGEEKEGELKEGKEREGSKEERRGKKRQEFTFWEHFLPRHWDTNTFKKQIKGVSFFFFLRIFLSYSALLPDSSFFFPQWCLYLSWWDDKLPHGAMSHPDAML